MQHHNEQLQKLQSALSDEQKRLIELNREQGASSWLAAIPLSGEGYNLTLPAPILDEDMKLTLIFVFTLLCGASKGFMKALRPYLSKFLF